MESSFCPFAARCGLDRSIATDAALRVWESFYCDGTFHRCERYLLLESGRAVPSRMLPNGRLLAPTPELVLSSVPSGPRPVPPSTIPAPAPPPAPRTG